MREETLSGWRKLRREKERNESERYIEGERWAEKKRERRVRYNCMEKDGERRREMGVIDIL